MYDLTVHRTVTMKPYNVIADIWTHGLLCGNIITIASKRLQLIYGSAGIVAIVLYKRELRDISSVVDFCRNAHGILG